MSDPDGIRLLRETVARCVRMSTPDQIDAYLAERRHRHQVLSLSEQAVIWKAARQLTARQEFLRLRLTTQIMFDAKVVDHPWRY